MTSPRVPRAEPESPPPDSREPSPRFRVTVCVCTFRRPHLLQQTLEGLRDLVTGGLFTYSIAVADNDAAGSARDTVAAFAHECTIEVRYAVAPEQNISLARNRALEMADGDLVAWIDDDEIPPPDWLLLLVTALQRYHCDGILAPVQPRFERTPPSWILKGRFFEKPRHPTGLMLRWTQTSTANVLMKRSLVSGLEQPFRPQFGSGCEDLDLFRRLMTAGYTFVWNDDAVVTEIVPQSRWTRRYLLRRALLRGRNGAGFADLREIAKSVIAVPLYSLLLPFLLLAGQHLFVRFLMKLGDHAGRLSGVLGLRIFGEKYLAG